MSVGRLISCRCRVGCGLVCNLVCRLLPLAAWLCRVEGLLASMSLFPPAPAPAPDSSEEMSNQVYNPTNSLPFDRLPPDGHVMPPPTNAPWNVTGLPWTSMLPQPPLVHFTGQMGMNTVLHCKRKPVEMEPIIPAKQFITEEKMAEHLSGLHISHDYTDDSSHNDYNSHSVHSEDMEVAPQTVKEPHEWLRGAHKVVLADEIKRLQEDPLIPPSLLQRLEKPCMSLMVWTPKEKLLDPKEEEDESKKNRNPSATSQRRNGLLVAEHNSEMDVEM